MNKVIVAIDRQKSTIAANVQTKGISAQKLKEISSSLDMPIDEFCKFQELKSLAYAEGKLTLEESQTIYCYLGEPPEHFNLQPLEVKVVLTKIFSELLGMRIKGK